MLYFLNLSTNVGTLVPPCVRLCHSSLLLVMASVSASASSSSLFSASQSFHTFWMAAVYEERRWQGGRRRGRKERGDGEGIIGRRSREGFGGTGWRNEYTQNPRASAAPPSLILLPLTLTSFSSSCFFCTRSRLCSFCESVSFMYDGSSSSLKMGVGLPPFDSRRFLKVSFSLAASTTPNFESLYFCAFSFVSRSRTASASVDRMNAWSLGSAWVVRFAPGGVEVSTIFNGGDHDVLPTH